MMYYELLFGRMPWNSRDVISFVYNIKTVPLKFPIEKPIPKESKCFI